MILTQTEIQLIEPLLKGIRCPLCGSNRIFYSREPFELKNSIPEGKRYAKQSCNGVTLYSPEVINCLHGECYNCGYVILRNLDTLFKIANEETPPPTRGR